MDGQAGQGACAAVAQAPLEGLLRVRTTAAAGSVACGAPAGKPPGARHVHYVVMAASISSQEPDGSLGQLLGNQAEAEGCHMGATYTSTSSGRPVFLASKLDLLLVGDVNVHHLACAVQKFFSNTEEVTITICDAKRAAALVNNCVFNMIFLRTTPVLTAEELEAIKSIRFDKRENIHLLFVFIIPENFKGCVSGYGADITLSEPLTTEKMNIVLKYWRAYFTNGVKNENALRTGERTFSLQSCSSKHLEYFSANLFARTKSVRHDIRLELNASLSDFENSKKVFLHSSKEKMRRERIKYCCEQLRALLPYEQGRKNDMASVIEATVDYVKYVRDRIPPAVLRKISEAIKNNKKYWKKPQAIQLCLQGPVMSQRKSTVLTSKYSPVREMQLVADKCLDVYSEPAAGGSLDESMRGQSSSTSESIIGDLYKTRIPSAALSLNSFHAVKYYSKVILSYNSAAVTNQNIDIHLPSAMPKVSKFLPQQCNSMLGQTHTAQPNCLQQYWAY
ncbi:spermatogenesis- and oogenesis-specific basic helix-loop-helix-containing protein 2 [Perognathus longimembris pacificus]|uniref:spermatogenesis- and oogenesis-specific basic helix-loop-helix-containing protein 2 n=1 Tax=Perognathus longimembris pacificus TaxID=214514 RepID=UPI002019BA74|nr:spermatogenesis- and oogenesis-specific basic helix-loop-helix-containing protein 2 [Perognathus longimembris pacificus]